MNVERMKISDALLNEAELASRLRLAVTRLARRLRQHANAEEQICPSQLAALSSGNRLGPVTLGDLADIERVQPPTLTRVVPGLDGAGQVSRHRQAHHRRIARLQTADAGPPYL